MKRYLYFLIFCVLILFFLLPEGWNCFVTCMICDYWLCKVFRVVSPLLFSLSLIALWKKKIWKIVRWILVFLVVITTFGKIVDVVTSYTIIFEKECNKIYGCELAITKSDFLARCKIESNVLQVYPTCIKLQEKKYRTEKVLKILPLSIMFFGGLLYLIYPIILFLFHLFRKILSKLRQKEKNS